MENTVDGFCADAPSFNADQYSENVGTGPFPAVKAANEAQVDIAKVKTEVATDLKGNTLGLALLNEDRKSQDGPLVLADLQHSAETSKDILSNDQPKRIAACKDVVRTILTTGKVVQLDSYPQLVALLACE